MAETFRTEEIPFGDMTVRIEYLYDDCGMDFPWEEYDGHGVIRKSNNRHYRGYDTDKKPGERPMNQPDRNEYQFYYDWQATMRKARGDWGLSDENKAALAKKLGRPPTLGEITHASVQRDFDYCCKWLKGDIFFIGIELALLDADGEEVEISDIYPHNSLWGVEYGHYDCEYAEGEAKGMAEGLIQAYNRECNEAQYWAERDVVTA